MLSDQEEAAAAAAEETVEQWLACNPQEEKTNTATKRGSGGGKSGVAGRLRALVSGALKSSNNPSPHHLHETLHSSDASSGNSGAAVAQHHHTQAILHEQQNSNNKSKISSNSNSSSGNHTNPNQAGSTDNKKDDGEAEEPRVFWERAFVDPASVCVLLSEQIKCQPRNLAREWVLFDDDDENDGQVEEADEPHAVMGISKLCAPGGGDKDVHAARATAGGSGSKNSPQQQQEDEASPNRQQPQSPQKVITSRMHEDIEVLPGHHVQVRLPPTNPRQRDVVSKTLDFQVTTTTTQASATPPSTPAHKSSSQQQLQNNKTATTRSSRTSTTKSLSHQHSAPVDTLTVHSHEAAELERSISELTMRSSYACTTALQATSKSMPENRRMAYYAVGKHQHSNRTTGGNRRCYFTGKLILGGAPFYAGSVQQGLRTLVVFCLPSALGLPDKESLAKMNGLSQLQPHVRTGSFSTKGSGAAASRPHLPKVATNGSGSKSNVPLHHDTTTNTRSSLLSSLTRSTKRGKGSSVASASVANNSYASKSSRMSSSKFSSSLDDLSLSIDGDLDPNWRLDRDLLLSVLPPASPQLLQQMSVLYPEQFETLPMQVRDANQWKLYVKFCFFSGLPISEGEMHYKVRDDIAEQVYGEEIVMSHDVMEASTGRASAEILTLPNRTVIRYLRKHYAQQCSKLDDRVFQRANWERVAPEV